MSTAIWTLGSVQVSCGFPLTPTATLTLVDEDGEEHTVATYGTGPVDAAYKAVDEIVRVENDLSEFAIKAITRGIDAMGEVGRRMPVEFRETALGGLAATPTGKAVKERMPHGAQ